MSAFIIIAEPSLFLGILYLKCLLWPLNNVYVFLWWAALVGLSDYSDSVSISVSSFFTQSWTPFVSSPNSWVGSIINIYRTTVATSFFTSMFYSFTFLFWDPFRKLISWVLYCCFQVLSGIIAYLIFQFPVLKDAVKCLLLWALFGECKLIQMKIFIYRYTFLLCSLLFTALEVSHWYN